MPSTFIHDLQQELRQLHRVFADQLPKLQARSAPSLFPRKSSPQKRGWVPSRPALRSVQKVSRQCPQSVRDTFWHPGDTDSLSDTPVFGGQSRGHSRDMSRPDRQLNRVTPANLQKAQQKCMSNRVLLRRKLATLTPQRVLPGWHCDDRRQTYLRIVMFKITDIVELYYLVWRLDRWSSRLVNQDSCDERVVLDTWNTLHLVTPVGDFHRPQKQRPNLGPPKVPCYRMRVDWRGGTRYWGCMCLKAVAKLLTPLQFGHPQERQGFGIICGQFSAGFRLKLFGKRALLPSSLWGKFFFSGAVNSKGGVSTVRATFFIVSVWKLWKWKIQKNFFVPRLPPL